MNNLPKARAGLDLQWRRISSISLVVPLMILYLLAPVTPVTPQAASAMTSYRQAIEATRNEDWSRAARLLREAIEEDPQPRSELIGGPISGETAYLPHFYLGLALYHMGDCLRAPEHWRTSADYSVIQQSPRLEEMLRLQAECDSRFMASAAKNVDRALLQSERYLSLLSEQEADLGLKLLWGRNPGWNHSLSQMRARFDDVENRFEKAAVDKDPVELTEVEGQAAELLRDLRELSESILEEAGDEAERSRRTAEDLPTASREVIPRSDPIAPESSPGSPAPPPTLTSAIRAYFRADYSETLRILSAEDYEIDSYAAQAKLFEAAAYFAIYRLGGREKEAELASASSAVAACLAKSPNLQPEATLFSPPFRAFFEGQRKNES